MSANAAIHNSPERVRALRELAEQAARLGGRIAHEAFSEDYDVRRKKDGTEVTDIDERAQAEIVALLRAEHPDHAVLAEEGGDFGGPPPSNECIAWIIDPIDGTRNYVHGVPIYSCSIGVMCDGWPVAGAVYEPERDRMYAGDLHAGLVVDGKPTARRESRSPSLHGGPPKPLVGIPSSLHGPTYDVVQTWVSRVIVRNLGSTALHLALVAAGRLHGALISDSRLWDIVGGAAMLHATGGVITWLDGRDLFPLDLAQVADAAIPCLASLDRDTHDTLLPAG